MIMKKEHDPLQKNIADLSDTLKGDLDELV